MINTDRFMDRFYPTQALLQRERDHRVPHFALHLAVAPGADHDVSFAILFVGHGRGLGARWKLHALLECGLSLGLSLHSVRLLDLGQFRTGHAPGFNVSTTGLRSTNWKKRERGYGAFRVSRRLRSTDHV